MNKILSLWIIIMLFVVTTHAQYNVDAHPKKQIKEAKSIAKKENKHILVMIGGDWCIWCKRFDQLINKDSAVAKELNLHYVLVHVSHTKEKPNKSFLKKYNQPQRMGFPVFLILNEKGKLIHTQNSAYLEKNGGEPGHDPALVIEFLRHWQPGYQKNK